MATLSIYGHDFDVSDDFKNLPEEDQQRLVNETAEKYNLSPDGSKADPSGGSNMLKAAEESVMNELPANVMEGAGALWRTAQNDLVGHGKLGDAVVDSLERGSHALRQAGRSYYTRPTDVPDSPSAALESGDVGGAVRSLGYRTAEGLGSALPALAGLAAAPLTAGVSIPLGMGLTGIQTAGQAEQAHGEGTGLNKSDLANIGLQTAIARIPGVGPKGEIARGMAGQAAQNTTDYTQGKGTSDDLGANSLLDAALSGGIIGATNKYMVTPIAKKTFQTGVNLADNVAARKGDLGDALQRISENQKANNTYAEQHEQATKEAMNANPDMSYADAMDAARDKLASQDIMQPEYLDPMDRKTQAEGDWQSNFKAAQGNLAGTTKPSDATIANALLDQAKTDSNAYIKRLRQAGLENGGIDAETAETMKKMVYAAGTHNHDRLAAGGDFVSTPEDQVRGLNIPEREKQNFIRQLDQLSMSAYNGREGAQGTLGRTILKGAATGATNLGISALALHELGLPGVLAAQAAKGVTDGAVGQAGRWLERRLGVGGAPTMRGAAQRARLATRAGIEQTPTMQDFQQQNIGDATARARQTIAEMALARAAKNAPKGPPDTSTTFQGDPWAKQGTPNWRPNPNFNPQATEEALKASARPSPEPSYMNASPNAPSVMDLLQARMAYQKQQDDAKAAEVSQRQQEAIERAKQKAMNSYRLSQAKKGAKAQGIDPSGIWMDPTGRIRARVPAGKPQQAAPTPPNAQAGEPAERQAAPSNKASTRMTVKNVIRNMQNNMPSTENPLGDLPGVASKERYNGAIMDQNRAFKDALTDPRVPKGAEDGIKLLRDVKLLDDKETIAKALMKEFPQSANDIDRVTTRLRLRGSKNPNDAIPPERLAHILKTYGLKKP